MWSVAMFSNRYTVLILLGIILSASAGGVLWGGYHLIAEQGLSDLFSSKVMGVALNQKTLSSLSVFVLLPFGLSGILMGIYTLSVEFAMKLLNSAALIVSMIGSTLNYFFTVTIPFLFH
jgi:hypothetical protein